MSAKRRISSKDHKIRKVVADDAKMLVNLRKDVWKKDVPEAYYIWKYFENPSGDHYSYVGLVESEVLALAGGVSYKFRLNKQDIIAVQSFDWEAMSSKAAGLFIETIKFSTEKMSQDGMAFHYGFTNKNSTPFCTEKLHYLHGFSLPRMDRPINAAKLYGTIGKKGIKANIASIGTRVVNLFSSEKNSKNFQLEEIDDFDERFDRLWAVSADHFPMTSARTRDYLKWRYLRHPVFTYKIVAAAENDSLLGFIVFRHAEADDKDVRRGYIVDLFTVLDRQEIWEALISRAVNQLIEKRMDIISCWMFEHSPYFKAFKKHFFFKRESDLTFTSHPFVDSISAAFLNQPENWYLTMGDSDIF